MAQEISNKTVALLILGIFVISIVGTMFALNYESPIMLENNPTGQARVALEVAPVDQAASQVSLNVIKGGLS